MFPRTRFIPLAVGVLLLSAACGSPPEALPTGPTMPPASGAMPASGVAPPPLVVTPPPVATPPTGVTPTGVMPTYTYPTRTPVATLPTTTPPATTSPTATPSYAPRCTGQPTGAQVVALAKKSPAVPDKNVAVLGGPFCSGTWSFTVIGMTGAEPLSVVTTGSGTTLTLVTVGTDVCNPTVKTQAPAGIRALACGY
ncbi:hypothetical protein AB0G04_14850 [Actinoplanes sp. NPDC023801]|uniref:hypothetical protein n=1 Tax=Actinoplanes sp. NPDC023801 TaxID=3154595 RepID=UPI003408BAB3